MVVTGASVVLVDLERLASYERLVAIRDGFDSQRTHSLRQMGREDRRETVLPALLTAWAQRRIVEGDPAPVLKPARRQARWWPGRRRTA